MQPRASLRRQTRRWRKPNSNSESRSEKAFHAEPMVCTTLRWRKVDSNRRSLPVNELVSRAGIRMRARRLGCSRKRLPCSRDHGFESAFLQRGVCKLSVPRAPHAGRAPYPLGCRGHLDMTHPQLGERVDDGIHHGTVLLLRGLGSSPSSEVVWYCGSWEGGVCGAAGVCGNSCWIFCKCATSPAVA